MLLLLVAVAFIQAAWRSGSDPGMEPVARPPAATEASSTTATATATTTTAVLPADSGTTTAPPTLEVPRSAPVSLRVPALDLSVSLSELGLNGDGTVEVPTDFQEPGWFRLGPTPGQMGSAVILGHVDSYRGPAVFFRLRTLQPGDQVEVDLQDGSMARFQVESVASYLKDEFPAEKVYASHGYRALTLVTCGGEFDEQVRSYRSNIVAYTRFVSYTPAPGSLLSEAVLSEAVLSEAGVSRPSPDLAG